MRTRKFERDNKILKIKIRICVSELVYILIFETLNEG